MKEKPTARGRRYERKIAKKLGGKRVAIFGRPTLDVIAGYLAIEVKTRARTPELLDWIDRTRNMCDREAFLPGVVLALPRKRRYLIFFDLDDFAEWHLKEGELERLKKEGKDAEGT